MDIDRSTDRKPSKLARKPQRWKGRVDERAFWLGLWLTNRATRTVAQVVGSVGLDGIWKRPSVSVRAEER